jgi:hypothetical protein
MDQALWAPSRLVSQLTARSAGFVADRALRDARPSCYSRRPPATGRIGDATPWQADRGSPPVGSVTRITTTDPGRLLLTENLGDNATFDTPQLHGISKTAPYFHNNSSATLEEVVVHYEELFKAVIAANGGIPFPILTTDGITLDRPNQPAERAALVAYLRKL